MVDVRLSAEAINILENDGSTRNLFCYIILGNLLLLAK